MDYQVSISHDTIFLSCYHNSAFIMVGLFLLCVLCLPFIACFFISVISLTFLPLMITSQIIASQAMVETLPPAPTPLQPHEAATLDFNFNVAVIVAAMLCAFVCALGLNSTLQCVFRGTRRAVTETLQWVASRRHNSGLKEKDMVALPTATYSNSGSPSRSSGCAICLAEFADGEKIRVLPRCNHWFHVSCIDKWLLSHSSCPTCRNQLKSNDPVPSVETVITL